MPKSYQRRRARSTSQAGGSFVYGHSDYGRSLKGYGGYGTIDFRPHLGLMLDFHQANEKDNKIYERTYEVGVRYVRHYGRLDPYAKIMYGRGVFNFPSPIVQSHRPFRREPCLQPRGDRRRAWITS